MCVWQDPESDLCAELMGFKSQLCLAQAQECILEKSILDNRKPLIISKVPYWIRIRLPLKQMVIFPEEKGKLEKSTAEKI